MALQSERTSRGPAMALAGVVAVTACLYLAREILIPLATAVLFAFLLAPAVRRLELLGLGRVVPSAVAVTLGVALLVGIGWLMGNQLVNLAGKLPEYKQNISGKLQALRSPPKEGSLAKAAKAIRELESETRAPGEARKPAPQAEALTLPGTPLELIGLFGVPLITLLGAAVAMVVLTLLLLLQRDDLRDRILRLAGAGRINATTQALEDASGRVTRYLVMQLLVNAIFGLSFGIALHLVGLPNAALWGVLGALLRFVPYIGAWAAASMPLALAFAIGDGWSLLAWTVGVIAVLELTFAYVIEPWLYGQSTGLSPIAVVGSAIFWTWLWGPIGLLLAMPITVSVAAIARHIPQLGFLNVMLGVEPVLPPGLRFYHRLLALELEEALDLASRFAREHGIEALYEQVMLPALAHAKRDIARYDIDERRERFVLDSMLEIMEQIDERGADAARPGKVPAPEICIAAAHDEVDYVAGVMLARLLAPESFDALLLPRNLLAGEILERIAADCGQAVCISAVPPSAAAHAGYLCKRLRRRFPQQKIVVVLWHAEGDLESVTQRLIAAGADIVATRLPDAAEQVRKLALPVRLAKESAAAAQ
jgi:predicted PurR-regulated permease PerM